MRKIHILIALIFLAIPTIQAGSVDIQFLNPVTGNFFSDLQPLTVCPRTINSQDVKLVITNHLTFPNTYKLSLILPEGWNGDIEPQITVAGGSTKQVDLNITIPSKTSPGLYFVTILAKSTDQTQMQLPILILNCYGFEIDIQKPDKFCIENPVKIELNITNIGKFSENVSLSAKGNGNVSFSQTNFELNPGNKKSLFVTIKPNQPGIQNITLIATSEHISSLKDMEIEAEDCWKFETQLSPSEIVECLNRTATLNLVVKNLGRPDIFFVSAPSFYYNFTLPENSSKQIQFNITSMRSGNGSFEISVHSGNDSQPQKIAVVIQAIECSDVKIDIPNVSICNNVSKIAINIILKNTGTMADSFSLTASTGQLNQSRINLASGEEKVIGLTVDTKKLNTAYIELTANNSKISKTVFIPVEIKPCWSVGIEPENVTVCNCPVSFNLQLKNTGLYADNYTIKWDNVSQNVKLEPGQTVPLQLNWSIPCNKTANYSIPIKINSNNVNVQKNISLTVHQSCLANITGFIIGPEIPIWKSAIVAAITILILAILIIKFAVLVK
jgi:uncharacterized membrane protein